MLGYSFVFDGIERIGVWKRDGSFDTYFEQGKAEYPTISNRLLWSESVLGVGVLLFGLGLGWNLSFVAATAELADRTAPAERGKLLGLNDLLAALLGAGLALAGGVALDVLGVAALAIGATVLVTAPIAWLIARRRQAVAEPGVA